MDGIGVDQRGPGESPAPALTWQDHVLASLDLTIPLFRAPGADDVNGLAYEQPLLAFDGGAASPTGLSGSGGALSAGVSDGRFDAPPIATVSVAASAAAQHRPACPSQVHALHEDYTAQSSRYCPFMALTEAKHLLGYAPSFQCRNSNILLQTEPLSSADIDALFLAMPTPCLTAADMEGAAVMDPMTSAWTQGAAVMSLDGEHHGELDDAGMSLDPGRAWLRSAAGTAQLAGPASLTANPWTATHNTVPEALWSLSHSLADVQAPLFQAATVDPRVSSQSHLGASPWVTSLASSMPLSGPVANATPEYGATQLGDLFNFPVASAGVTSPMRVETTPPSAATGDFSSGFSSPHMSTTVAVPSRLSSSRRSATVATHSSTSSLAKRKTKAPPFTTHDGSHARPFAEPASGRSSQFAMDDDGLSAVESDVHRPRVISARRPADPASAVTIAGSTTPPPLVSRSSKVAELSPQVRGQTQGREKRSLVVAPGIRAAPMPMSPLPTPGTS